MAKLVEKTYGDALFQLGKEKNELDSFYEEGREIQKLLKENTDLSKIFTHPDIDKAEKHETLDRIFEGRVETDMLGFLHILIEKDRFSKIDAIFEYYTDCYREYRHIGVVYITSAMELTDRQQAMIEEKILKTTSYKKLIVHKKTDKELIGGVVIRIRDRVVDSSVKTKLENLTRQLKQIQIR